MIGTAAVCVYLDSFLFNRFNLYGVRPDTLLAATAAMGVLFSNLPAMITGGAAGLLMDVLFNKAVGLSAAAYIVTGALAGSFFKKFYADNPVIPALTAAICAFLKEHVSALFLLIAGGRFPYVDMLFGYILPCALATGGFCVLIYLILKRGARERLYHLEHKIGGKT